MYYDALTSNIPSGIDPDTLQSLTQMPSINSPVNNLLPSNFTSINANQIETALNPKNLNNLLDSNLSQIKPFLSDNVAGSFNNLVPTSLANPSDFSSSISSLESSLQKIQDKFSADSAQQILSIFNNNNSTESLGAITQSFTSTISDATNLSPKGIRDIQNPDKLMQQVQQTTDKTMSSVKEATKNQIAATTSNQTFSNNSQSNLQQISAPPFSGNNKDGFSLFVRVTVYWAYGSGTDKDSAAKRSSTGRQLAQGISAAVDPSVIPYLSRLEIPGIGTRFATDTGGAVKARTASAGRLPIVDVFFEKKEDALAFANSLKKNEVTIKVYPPSSKYTYVKNSPPTYGVA